jgi:hypothetical protein
MNRKKFQYYYQQIRISYVIIRFASLSMAMRSAELQYGKITWRMIQREPLIINGYITDPNQPLPAFIVVCTICDNPTMEKVI